MPDKKKGKASNTETVVKAPKKVEPMVAESQGKGKQSARGESSTKKPRVTFEQGSSSRADSQKDSSKKAPESSTASSKDDYGTIKSQTASSAAKTKQNAGIFEGCEPGGYWDQWCCRKHFEMGQEDHDL